MLMHEIPQTAMLSANHNRRSVFPAEPTNQGEHERRRRDECCGSCNAREHQRPDPSAEVDRVTYARQSTACELIWFQSLEML